MSFYHPIPTLTPSNLHSFLPEENLGVGGGSVGVKPPGWEETPLNTRPARPLTLTARGGRGQAGMGRPRIKCPDCAPGPGVGKNTPHPGRGVRKREPSPAHRKQKPRSLSRDGPAQLRFGPLTRSAGKAERPASLAEAPRFAAQPPAPKLLPRWARRFPIPALAGGKLPLRGRSAKLFRSCRRNLTAAGLPSAGPSEATPAVAAAVGRVCVCVCAGVGG